MVCLKYELWYWIEEIMYCLGGNYLGVVKLCSFFKKYLYVYYISTFKNNIRYHVEVCIGFRIIFWLLFYSKQLYLVEEVFKNLEMCLYSKGYLNTTKILYS